MMSLWLSKAIETIKAYLLFDRLCGGTLDHFSGEPAETVSLGDTGELQGEGRRPIPLLLKVYQRLMSR